MSEVNLFFGVYLLYSLNEKYRGRIYIGFTVNPERRKNQHNKGVKFGGARQTNNRGPWDMVLMVHGFPNEIAALRFEWAWQHPQNSRRLKSLPPKKKSERSFNYRLRILEAMLSTNPWTRLPLTLQWLDPSYKSTCHIDIPNHVRVCFGPIEKRKDEDSPKVHLMMCYFCRSKLQCTNTLECTSCHFAADILCCAKYFLGDSNRLIPTEGNCPVCLERLIWWDLISSLLLRIGKPDSTNKE